MSARGMENLIAAGVGLSILFALVVFAKVFLSNDVATFVAGLGTGAMGAAALRAFSGQTRP